MAETTQVRRRDRCRVCDGPRLEPILSLEPTPPANEFVSAANRGCPQETFPLDVFMCADCAHVQLLDIVDPGRLFREYVYVSGTSPVFVSHFRDYAAAVSRFGGLVDGELVIDVGSNDGTLLGMFREAGQRVLGIDPAVRIAQAAGAGQIETLPEFFTPDLARALAKERGRASLVTANNVFAHVDDLLGFLEGVGAVLDAQGLFVFEVSYLLDVYEKTLFDTIYHEHLSYHSVKPLLTLFGRGPLELIHVERVGSHGGSLRGYAQPRGARRPVSTSVDQLIALEAAVGLHTPPAFHRLFSRIENLRCALHEQLADIKQQGRRIVGFGAPAKATTLTHHFRLGGDVLEYVIDDSPWKQGLFTPGHHVPVVPADRLYTDRPDYALLLAWNFAEPIMAKHRAWTSEGGRFIVPLPELRVYP